MDRRWTWAIGAIVTLAGILAVVLLATGTIAVFPDSFPGRLWVAGAAALGLLSGFSTGISQEGGAAKELAKFVGAGLLVPLLGGVGALLGSTEEVTEQSTYSGTQLVQKTTRTVKAFPDGSLQPIAVSGSFFLTFGLLAPVGVVGGALLKKDAGVKVTIA